MKNILVPTDFSACATYATKAAMDIAAYYQANVHLYTVLPIHKNWSNLSRAEQMTRVEDLQSIHNAEQLFEEWKSLAKERNIELSCGWSAGNLIEMIKEYCEDYHIDFITMGSHGASGKNEHFIGSNTQKVVRSVHCPVLIVKNDMEDYKIKRVVFASDFDENDKIAFQYFLNFVTPFQPEVHLLAVNTSSWFGQPYILMKEAMNDFKEMCGDLKCHTHFYRDWTVDAGIRHLTEEVGANLIGISNQERHTIKRIFAGSNVEALVNHAPVPVLSIDFSKVMHTSKV